MEKKPQNILSIVGIGTILSLGYSALNYATQITLVELFGYRLRGIFEILMSILGLTSILFSFNLYTAINLHVSKNSATPANLVKIGSSVLLVQVVAISILYVFSPKQGIVPEHLQTLFLVLLIIAAVLNHKVNEFTAILNGNQYFIKAKILSLVGSAFSGSLILLAYFLGHSEVNLIVWLAVIGPFAGSYLYAKALTLTNAGLRARAGLLNFKSMYRENGAIYLISLAQFISFKLYLLYLARSESIEALGIFSLAYSITQFLLLPATLLATIIISNRSGSLGSFVNSFKILMGYGILSCAVVKIMIEVGVLEMLPLKSLHNSSFIQMLDVMVVSTPFAVLNILTVAIAIKKNMCSKMFVAGQMMMIPLMLMFYIFFSNTSVHVSAVPLAYVVTWLVASVFSGVALRTSLRKGRVSQ
ncbi:hypothetical protein [Massilia psychrophila]|nr:hypothetical protein [Massilia psychrophila]